jgi:tRNA threonylcarbamoyladenosine modification (KEOPS) complex  Pcc1 subunit
MSKQDESYSIVVKIKKGQTSIQNVFTALHYNVTSDKRVTTKMRVNNNVLSISIKARDFNILLAVNNSVMQALKMLETVDLYE